MRRQWFRADDGTYFRNAPLVMNERERTPFWRFIRQEMLAVEWSEIFAVGVARKDHLTWWRDKEVPQVSFREAYPHDPRMWIFDRKLGA